MAKKVKSSFVNMVLTLTLITVVASLALGSIYNMTLEPIAAAKKAARERASLPILILQQAMVDRIHLNSIRLLIKVSL